MHGLISQLFEYVYRDFKSNTARDLHRKHYTDGESNVVKNPSSNKQENRGTGTHSPIINERPQTGMIEEAELK